MNALEQYQRLVHALYEGMAKGALTAPEVEQIQEHLADMGADLDEGEQRDKNHLISSLNAMGPSWVSGALATSSQETSGEVEPTDIVAFHGPCGPDRCGVRLPIFRTGNKLWVWDPWGVEGGVNTYPSSQLEVFARNGAVIVAESELPKGVSPANAVVLCGGRFLAHLGALEPNPLPRRPAANGDVYYSVESRAKAQKRIAVWLRFFRRLESLENARSKPDQERLLRLARGIEDCSAGTQEVDTRTEVNPSKSDVVTGASAHRRPPEGTWAVAA